MTERKSPPMVEVVPLEGNHEERWRDEAFRQARRANKAVAGLRDIKVRLDATLAELDRQENDHIAAVDDAKSGAVYSSGEGERAPVPPSGEAPE